MQPDHPTHTADTPRFHQTDTTAGGLVSTVTTVHLVAPRSAVRAALVDAPWTWWREGAVRDWKRGDDGSVQFTLQPLAPTSGGRIGLPSKVGIKLLPERPLPSTESQAEIGIVFPAEFSGDFAGKGRYEIVDAGEGAVLRSCWDRVKRCAMSVRMLPMNVFVAIHLGSEKGSLRWPLPSGTGFAGLIDHLEKTGGSEP